MRCAGRDPKAGDASAAPRASDPLLQHKHPMACDDEATRALLVDMDQAGELRAGLRRSRRERRDRVRRKRKQDTASALMAEADAAGRVDFNFLCRALAGLAAYFAVGIYFYTHVRPLGGIQAAPPTVVDVIYFIMVTLTTVGYGDFHPLRQDDVSLLFTCFFILAGISLASLLLSFLIGKILDSNTRAISKAMELSDDPDQPGIFGMTRRTREVVIVAAIVLLLMALGVAAFCVLEGLSPVQAFYVVCVSMTTVGFGDVVPLQQSTKVFATVWLALSTLALAKCVSLVVEWRAEEKLDAMRRVVLSRPLDENMFSLVDEDGDGTVTKYEFLVHGLLSGEYNVTEDDIEQIMGRFDELDLNSDGLVSMDEARVSSSMTSLDGEPVLPPPDEESPPTQPKR